jgi:hypothetical protein
MHLHLHATHIYSQLVMGLHVQFSLCSMAHIFAGGLSLILAPPPPQLPSQVRLVPPPVLGRGDAPSPIHTPPSPSPAQPLGRRSSASSNADLLDARACTSCLPVPRSLVPLPAVLMSGLVQPLPQLVLPPPAPDAVRSASCFRPLPR